jgi:hypothetical protein
MLNDSAMVKIVKQGNKKGRRLFVYNVKGNYYFSDTYGIYKIYPDYHKKTAQEISKIFLGLPGEGESRGINNKEKTDSIPSIVKIFFDAEKTNYEHELKATNFLEEVKDSKGKVVMTARILVNNNFATLLNNDYFATIESHHTIKTNGRNSATCVFMEYGGEKTLLALIMPVKSREPEQLDKFVSMAA